MNRNSVNQQLNDAGIENLLTVYSTFLEAIPNPAMIIRGSDKIVMSVNKIASDFGVKVGGHCWREFMKEEHLSEIDKEKIKKYPGLVPADFGIKCTFCKGDECLAMLPNQNNCCLDAFGKKWDTYWIRSSKDLFLHYAIDITEKFNMEIKLKESEAKYQYLFKNGSDALFLIEKETGSILGANDAASEKYGYSNEEFIKLKNLDVSAEPEKTKEWTENFCGGKVTIPIRYHKKKNGAVFPVEITASMCVIGGREVQLIACRDISDRIRSESEIKYLSYHDYLTGLYNRRFFEEEFKRLDVERNLPLTLVMADVNGLKLFNDSFGHSVGDELLKNVAKVLKTACRSDDIIARVGGDEFVIILPKTSGLETKELTNRIEELLQENKVSGNNISLAIGYQTKSHQEQKIETLYKEAEEQMYKHKLYESEKSKSDLVNMAINIFNENIPGESKHAIRVSEICQKFATYLNFNEDKSNLMKKAGLLHDIGKISMNVETLKQHNQLNLNEWKEMKRHPEVGYHILNSIDEFREVATFVLQHHEKWDGSGYPKGIKGSDISIEARIIAVAEAYDIMVEGNYKEAISVKEAIAELECCSGTHFDPEIVTAFIKLISNE